MKSDYPCRYLYRLLRKDEKPCTDGIKAKSPEANVSIYEHVLNGSKGVSSKYISTSKTEHGVLDLRDICTESPKPEVVKIDCKGLQEVQYYDLSTVENCRRYLLPDTARY